MLKKALVITSQGLGDGLMMMIASERLRNHGYNVVTLNDHLIGLKNWFPNHFFQKCLPLNELEEYSKNFDLVILQNDNTEKSRFIIRLHQKGVIRSLSIFYSSYERHKHPPLTSWDVVFDPDRPMVENISKSIACLLRCHDISTNNGIIAPRHLLFRRFPRRIILHPTASTEERMWPMNSFIQLADLLKQIDLDPIFSLSTKERIIYWKDEYKKFFTPKIQNLAELADLIYESGYVIGNESGVVHLASNLQIPNLVITGHNKRIKLWRPGWLLGAVAAPSEWIPNWKFWRYRESNWKRLITPKFVKRRFEILSKKC